METFASVPYVMARFSGNVNTAGSGCDSSSHETTRSTTGIRKAITTKGIERRKRFISKVFEKWLAPKYGDDWRHRQPSRFSKEGPVETGEPPPSGIRWRWRHPGNEAGRGSTAN